MCGPFVLTFDWGLQVGTSPIVLNWSDAYVVLAPSAGVVYCWLGDGASPEEIECCSSIAETAIIKQAGAKKVVVKQGEEPQAFWESFGGKTNVKTVHKAKGQGQAEPRSASSLRRVVVSVDTMSGARRKQLAVCPSHLTPLTRCLPSNACKALPAFGCKDWREGAVVRGDPQLLTERPDER